MKNFHEVHLTESYCLFQDCMYSICHSLTVIFYAYYYTELRVKSLFCTPFRFKTRITTELSSYSVVELESVQAQEIARIAAEKQAFAGSGCFV